MLSIEQEENLSLLKRSPCATYCSVNGKITVRIDGNTHLRANRRHQIAPLGGSSIAIWLAVGEIVVGAEGVTHLVSKGKL